MNGKPLIWGGMVVGSAVGSFLPYAWGGGFFAQSIFGSIGGIAGIYVGFKLAKEMGGL